MSVHSSPSASLLAHEVPMSAYLKCEHIVGKDNHFVSPVLVILDKELTRLELSWVHAVKQDTFT
jgi:hypothetical protein